MLTGNVGVDISLEPTVPALFLCTRPVASLTGCLLLAGLRKFVNVRNVATPGFDCNFFIL